MSAARDRRRRGGSCGRSRLLQEPPVRRRPERRSHVSLPVTAPGGGAQGSASCSLYSRPPRADCRTGCSTVGSVSAVTRAKTLIVVGEARCLRELPVPRGPRAESQAGPPTSRSGSKIRRRGELPPTRLRGPTAVSAALRLSADRRRHGATGRPTSAATPGRRRQGAVAEAGCSTWTSGCAVGPVRSPLRRPVTDAQGRPASPEDCMRSSEGADGW